MDIDPDYVVVMLTSSIFFPLRAEPAEVCSCEFSLDAHDPLRMITKDLFDRSFVHH